MHTKKEKYKRKISKSLISEICNLIDSGTPSSVAAKAVGVCHPDFTFWMLEGAKPDHQKNCPNCDFAMFFNEISSAEARAESILYASLMKESALGDKQATIYLLDKYHREKQIELNKAKVISHRDINIGTTMAELAAIISSVKANRHKELSRTSNRNATKSTC